MNPCECPSKIGKALEKHHGCPIELNLKMMVSREDKATEYKTYFDFPPLEYWYMKGKKRVKTHIPFNFCPVCGQPKREGVKARAPKVEAAP
jgi:hypothetical protein